MVGGQKEPNSCQLSKRMPLKAREAREQRGCHPQPYNEKTLLHCIDYPVQLRVSSIFEFSGWAFN